MPPAYTRIRYKDMDTNSDYARMTSDFFRTRAATVLQRAFRQYRLRRDEGDRQIETKRPHNNGILTRYNNAKTGLNSLSSIQEPTVSDIRFLKHLKKKAKKGQYHLIHYQHQDFTRYLFQALRLSYLSKSELLTIKLMHDAILACHHGEMPAGDISCIFKRYPLKLHDKGPYHPEHIVYWSKETTAYFKKAKKKAKHFTPHYYTIDFNPEQTATFFYFFIQNNCSPKEIRYLLNNYILQKCTDSVRRATLFKEVMSVEKENKTLLLNFIQSVSPGCPEYDFRKSKAPKEIKSMKFLVNLLNIRCQIPSLVLSPHFKYSDSMTPTLSFVIPTTETHKLLQSVLHGEEASQPEPIVGEASTRMIRAMEELPHTQSNSSRSILSLQTLYPDSMKLKKSSRPVEITHPDVRGTQMPHDYDCFDFFLTWHDLLHAWRNGANFKKPIRHLRQLHDEKAGLAHNQTGMSNVIWALSDIDFSGGRSTRERQQNLLLKNVAFLLSFIHILERAGFNYETPTDDNDLILYDMVKHADDWQAFFFDQSMDEIFSSFQQYISTRWQTRLKDSFDTFLALFMRIPSVMEHDSLKTIASKLKTYFPMINDELLSNIILFFLRHQDMRILLNQHPKASLPEIILRQLLSSDTTVKETFFDELSARGYNTFLYYSANSGLYFSHSVREWLDVLPYPVNYCLRKNSRATLHHALSFMLQEIKPSSLTLEKKALLKKKYNSEGNRLNQPLFKSDFFKSHSGNNLFQNTSHDLTNTSPSVQISTV